MNIMSWLLMIGIAWSAGARSKQRSCEGYLSSREEIVYQIELPKSHHLIELASHEQRLFEKWVAREGLSLISDPRGRMIGLAFDRRDGQKDQGFVMIGRVQDRVLRVEQAFRSTRESLYFDHLAHQRQVEGTEIKLEEKILGCDSLWISGGAQVKIEMKHLMDFETALHLVRKTRVQPVIKNRGKSAKPSYVIRDSDHRGRRLEIILKKKPVCPHELKTVYFVN